MNKKVQSIALFTLLILLIHLTSCLPTNNTANSTTVNSISSSTTLRTTADETELVTTQPDEPQSFDIPTGKPSPDQFPKDFVLTSEDLVNKFEYITLSEGLEIEENKQVAIDDVIVFFSFIKIENGTNEKGVHKFNYMKYSKLDKKENTMIFRIPAKIVMNYLKNKFNVVTDVTTSEKYNKSDNTFKFEFYLNEFGGNVHIFYVSKTQKLDNNKYSIEYDVYRPDAVFTKYFTRQIVVELKGKDFKYISATTLKKWK